MHTHQYDMLMRNISDMERSLNRVNRELSVVVREDNDRWVELNEAREALRKQLAECRTLLSKYLAC